MNFFHQLALFAQEAAPIAQEAAPTAEAVVQRGPIAYYFYNAGLLYGVGIPLLALMITAAAGVMLAAVNRKVFFVLLLSFAILPLLLGVLGTVQGMVNSFHIIAMSESSPKPEVLAEGIRTAFFTTYVGAFASLPPLGMAIAGLVFKGNRRP